MLWYSSCFHHLIRWCYRTAVLEFVIFLLLFLVVSYLSTLIEVSDDDEFASKYGKYIVMASSLYMIVPFAFSNILLYGLFHKNSCILKVFMIGSIVNAIVILIVVLGSGIYLAIKGTAYIAYSLIGFAIILELILGHSILLVYGAREKYLQTSDERNNSVTTENIEET